MRFEHIKDESCPLCASAAVSDSVDNHDGIIMRHVNGGTWETRRFACGYAQQYVPNFEKVVIHGICTKTAAYAKDRAEKKDLLQKLKEVIADHPCKKDFKQTVLMYLPSVD